MRVSLVMLLSLCVLLQMLGVPATLLTQGDPTDPLGASVLEGLSIPPSLLRLTLLVETRPLAEVLSLLRVPVLAFAAFHPPVL